MQKFKFPLNVRCVAQWSVIVSIASLKVVSVTGQKMAPQIHFFSLRRGADEPNLKQCLMTNRSYPPVLEPCDPKVLHEQLTKYDLTSIANSAVFRSAGPDPKATVFASWHFAGHTVISLWL
jgi:hypothetical protein